MSLDELLPLDSDTDGLVDFRSLDYISSYDDHLMCPICRCPFIRPVRLHCDHVFCRECLHSAIANSGASRDDFKCPSCRASTNDAFMNVPRLLINMCDDIRVKCPFARDGCAEIVPRGHLQAHVGKYCDYRLVDCPAESCEKKTRKMDLDPEERCLHGLIRCSGCEEDVMEQDFEEHSKNLCPSLETTCPDCDQTVFRKALAEHIDACPEVVHPCEASKYGCQVRAKRDDLVVHQQQCALVTMRPYLEAQNSRLDSLDLTVRHLQQRNEIFEDGLASIRGSLADSSCVASSRSRDQPNSNPETQSSSSSPDIQDQHQQDSQSNATTYLLAVHESLRDEIANLSHAITDLDARASMAIMNECLRIKEDMAHTNAAVTSMRMQVQWLMNPRLHQGQRTLRPGAGAGAGASSESSPGPSNATTSPSPGALRPRRLSDSGREGTKL